MLKSQRAAAVKEVELTKTAAEEFESVKALLVSCLSYDLWVFAPYLACSSFLIWLRITQKKRIAELEETVQMERARPVRELAEKNEIIRRLKAAFKRKDEEFDQLMDTKIALAMEIRAYRQMLDKEELRLGYKSPVAGNKKRKLVTEEEEEDSELETNATQDEDGSTLMFTKYDLDGQCITIRNSSLNSISLEGWSVRSRATGNEFKLPADLTLASGNSRCHLEHNKCNFIFIFTCCCVPIFTASVFRVLCRSVHRPLDRRGCFPAPQPSRRYCLGCAGARVG